MSATVLSPFSKWEKYQIVFTGFWFSLFVCLTYELCIKLNIGWKPFSCLIITVSKTLGQTQNKVAFYFWKSPMSLWSYTSRLSNSHCRGVYLLQQAPLRLNSSRSLPEDADRLCTDPNVSEGTQSNKYCTKLLWRLWDGVRKYPSLLHNLLQLAIWE